MLKSVSAPNLATLVITIDIYSIYGKGFALAPAQTQFSVRALGEEEEGW